MSSFHLGKMLIPCCMNSVSVSPSKTELLLLLVIFPAAVPPAGGHRSSLDSPISPPPSLLVPPLRGWLETGVGSAAFLAAVSKREPEKEPQTEAGCGSPPPVCGCGGGSGSALDGRRQAVVHPPAQQNNRILRVLRA